MHLQPISIPISQKLRITLCSRISLSTNFLTNSRILGLKLKIDSQSLKCEACVLLN